MKFFAVRGDTSSQCETMLLCNSGHVLQPKAVHLTPLKPSPSASHLFNDGLDHRKGHRICLVKALLVFQHNPRTPNPGCCPGHPLTCSMMALITEKGTGSVLSRHFWNSSTYSSGNRLGDEAMN